jgi:hypothetical protein
MFSGFPPKADSDRPVNEYTSHRIATAIGYPRLNHSPDVLLTARRVIPIPSGSVGRTAARAECRKAGPGGKSGLHGHAVPDNVRRA